MRYHMGGCSPCPSPPFALQVVPAEWNALSARLYSCNLSNNTLCGDFPDALATAVGSAQRKDTQLGWPCPWHGDADALVHFKLDGVTADPLGALQDWRWDSNPCWWRGVTCREGRVSGVRLGGAKLSGGAVSGLCLAPPLLCSMPALLVGLQGCKLQLPCRPCCRDHSQRYCQTKCPGGPGSVREQLCGAPASTGRAWKATGAGP
jgi:hypothetical protein